MNPEAVKKGQYVTILRWKKQEGILHSQEPFREEDKLVMLPANKWGVGTVFRVAAVELPFVVLEAHSGILADLKSIKGYTVDLRELVLKEVSQEFVKAAAKTLEP